MKRKHCRSALSILVCLTMILTQLAPMSFADTVSPADVQTVTDDVSGDEVSDNQQNPVDTDNSASTAEDEEAAEDDAASSYANNEANAENSDSSEAAENKSAELMDEEAGEETTEEDLNPEISWYLNDTTASEFKISNADQLFGFAKLVNGTAKKHTKAEDGTVEDSAVSAVNFSGKTVKLTADIDLEDKDWTPIGMNSNKSFQGTFDGDGYTVKGMYINAPKGVSQYIGFFGYIRYAATIKNIIVEGRMYFEPSYELNGKVTGNTAYVGGIVGYVDGTGAKNAKISSVVADIEYTGNLSQVIVFGGIAGWCGYGNIEDCVSTGTYDSVEKQTCTSYNSSNVGGIVGYFKGYWIKNCKSFMDITSKNIDIAGIAAQVDSSTAAVISDCANYGDLKSTGALGNPHIGGIVANGSMQEISNVINEGNITTTASEVTGSAIKVYAGGIGGTFSAYSGCVAANMINTGNIIIPENNENLDIYAGGIAGFIGTGRLVNAVQTGKIVYKDYACDDNDYIALAATARKAGSYYSLNVFENIFTEKDKTCSLPVLYDDLQNGGLAEITAGIGIIGKNGNVKAYDDSSLLYDTDDLGILLNSYVMDNVDSVDCMKLWTLEDGIYQPTGISVSGVAAPSGKIYVKTADSDKNAEASFVTTAAGSNVVLTASIEADECSIGSTEISYQWYVSETDSTDAAVPAEGEGASGVLEGTSGTVKYTVSGSEGTTHYYFIRMTKKIVCTADDVSGKVSAEKVSDSDTVGLEFLNETGSFEAAASFESGNGTADSPYIIKTREQLKLMAEKMDSDSAYRSAYYKLDSDIDYGNALWTPAAGATSDTAFSGTLDGAGHKITNLKIAASKSAMISNISVNYTGLFAYVSGGTIKDLTISGVMRASEVRYAGGFAGYADGESFFDKLTSDIDVRVETALCVGGIVGYIDEAEDVDKVVAKVTNCINNGNIFAIESNDKTLSKNVYNSTWDPKVHIAGVVGGSKYNISPHYGGIYNCVNTGDVRSVAVKDSTLNLYLYTAGIYGYADSYVDIDNCINYGSISNEGCYRPNQTVNGIRPSASSSNMHNSYDMTASEESADTVRASLNQWIAENVAEKPGCASWVKNENGNLYPTGQGLEAASAPTVVCSVKTGDGEYTEVTDTSEALKLKTGDKVTLKAEIKAPDNKSGSSSISYTWYKADTADGKKLTAVKSGKIDGLEGTCELSVESDAYTENYYYIEAVNTVSYAKSGVDTSVDMTAVSPVCGMIFTTGSGKYEGTVSEKLEGEGTSASPYLISSAADLAFMINKVNANDTTYAAAGICYKLNADIDMQDFRTAPIGNGTGIFKGVFDGNGKIIKNINVYGTGTYAGLFGSVNAAEIKNLTVTGKVYDAVLSGYVGGIVGYAAGSSKITDCISEVDVTAAGNELTSSGIYTRYVGGIAGYLVKSSATGCKNNGTVVYERCGKSATAYVGGIAGGDYGSNTSSSKTADASLVNDINTGAVKVIAKDKYGGAYVGGIAGMINAACMVNCANTGAVSEEVSDESLLEGTGANYLAGILGLAGKTSNETRDPITMSNCVSYGTVKAVREKSTAYTGAAFINYAGQNGYINIENCFAPSTNGTDKVFNVSQTTGFWTSNALQSGNGYVDADGNVVIAEFINSAPDLNASSAYVRSSAVKTLMGGSSTELYYVLNGWAGNNNESLGYNSWVAAEGTSVYLPTGKPEKSPFTDAAVTVEINKSEYEGVFDKNTTSIPAMTVKVTAPESMTDIKYAYQWYKSSEEGTTNRTAIESSTAAAYTPSVIPGQVYYSADVTAVSGNYFKSVTSNFVKVSVAADYWTGESADIEELEGYGTEEDPYIIDTPDKLALVSSAFSTYYTKAPERPDPSDEDLDKTAVAFGTAVFKVTQDLDMGGLYSFKAIGTSAFKGHFYGEKSDGSIPVIKNLYYNSSQIGQSNTGIALFTSLATGSIVEKLKFENLKFEIDNSKTSANAAAVAAVASGGAIVRDIITEGIITRTGTSKSSPTTAGIVCSLQGAEISNCINRVNISVNGNGEGAFGEVTDTEANVGGIVASMSLYAGRETVVKDCINEGNIKGIDGVTYTGTGGIVGMTNSSNKTDASISVERCKNTGSVTGIHNAGGIVGSHSCGYITSCYNTGTVSSSLDATKADQKNIKLGGIAGGTGIYSNTYAERCITKCYNTGDIVRIQNEGEYLGGYGLITGFVFRANISDSCALQKDGIDAVDTTITEDAGSISNVNAVTAEELAGSYVMGYLGNAFYKNVSGNPLLDFEVSESDKCNLSLVSDNEDSSKAYLSIAGHKISSVNAVKGASISFKAAGDIGYEVTAVKDGEAALIPVDGVYTYTVNNAASKLAASVGKAAGYAVIVTDYAAAPDGKQMIAYRMSDELASGKAVYLGDVEMIHAAAYDKAVFIENPEAAGNAEVDKENKLDSSCATYIAFADQGQTLESLASQITVKDSAEGQVSVDYTDFDILGDGDGTPDVFDAQLIWNIMSGNADATDIQRLQADFNQDGTVDVSDVLVVHRAIMGKLIGLN